MLLHSLPLLTGTGDTAENPAGSVFMTYINSCYTPPLLRPLWRSPPIILLKSTAGSSLPISLPPFPIHFLTTLNFKSGYAPELGSWTQFQYEGGWLPT